jgi:NAD(P)-dependent dehydrogenase (short-subunit alcohol dehydrogenase family)
MWGNFYKLYKTKMMKDNRKTCLITGSSSGIGKETAIELSRKGYRVIMLCRDSEKSRNAWAEVKELVEDNDADLIYANLSSLDSIRKAAEEIKSKYDVIDVLINNAGVFKRKLTMSEDGIEINLAVNFLAPFLLTNLLLPLIKKSDSARIINMTSELYKDGKVDFGKTNINNKYNGNKAYANSKLLVVLFTYQLAKILKDDKITVNCVHPGVVQTDVFRDFPKWVNRMLGLFISKPEEGAKPSIYLASSDEVRNISGKYFSKMKIKETKEITHDENVRQYVWDYANKLTGLEK